MHTEPEFPPADDPRRESASNVLDQPSQPEQSGAFLPAQPRGEEWSAFTPATESMDDILLMPEVPTENIQPFVHLPAPEAILEESVNESSQAATVSAPAAAGAGQLQVFHDDMETLDSLSESAAAPSNEAVEALKPQSAIPDNYAVGMRILRISPEWLLLSTVGFFSLILLFSWMSRPAGNVEAATLDAGIKNEATNRAPLNVQFAPAPAANAGATAPARPAQAPTTPEEKRETQPAAPVPSPQVIVEPPVVAVPAGSFTVQVGSYSDISQANERVSKLRASGVEARTASVEIPQRGTWYRVQAGSFQTREEATRFGAELRAKGAADSVMVTEVEKR